MAPQRNWNEASSVHGGALTQVGHRAQIGGVGTSGKWGCFCTERGRQTCRNFSQSRDGM